MSQAPQNDASNQSNSPDYKAKLDAAATRAKSPPKEDQTTGIIEKAQYVPVVGKVLGVEEKQPEEESSPAGNAVPGPPHRPEHDTQIEEFLKDQHRSKRVIGVDKPKD